MKIEKNMIPVGVLALTAGLGTGCADDRANKSPNIIVILADDMGYGDLGCYGHPVIKTPHLDRMAAEGIRLTSFCAAASSSTPSRAGLLTGRYPIRSGMTHVIFPAEDKGFRRDEITLAESLRERGYATMCVGKWHLGQTREEFLPVENGFDNYFGLITSNDMMRPWVETDVPLHMYRDGKPTEEFPVDQHTLTQRYTQEAVKFIGENAGKPFFLYFAHSMPHVPIHASERFRGTSDAGLYGDVLAEIDWSVSEVLNALKKNGIDENTIVIFTSDNGPWLRMPPRMFKEDLVKPWHAGVAGVLREGKGWSYEGGFRVPCIVRWPGTIPAGQVSAKPANSLDLFPTLMQLASLPLPDRTYDGEDIFPMLAGDDSFGRTRDFYYLQGHVIDAVRSGAWKLRIARPQGHGKPVNDDLSPELYNLDLDPSENYNVAELYPRIVEQLRAKMVDHGIEGARTVF